MKRPYSNATHCKVRSAKLRLFFCFGFIILVPPAVYAKQPAVYAKQIECTIDSTLGGPTDLQFNTDTRTAEIVFRGPVGILHGRLTLVSKAGDGTDAYNFMFSDLPKKWVANDIEWEFILHRNGGDFVLFGAGYTFVNGERYLSSFHPMYPAHCISS